MSAPTEYLKEELEQLDTTMLEAEQHFRSWLNKVHPSQYKSACNLLHYLALRNQDIRELQDALHENGLSSLASSESHVRSQLLAILKHLNSCNGTEAEISFKSSQELLKNKSAVLFSSCCKYNVPCIMVTLDSTHAEDYPSVKNLLQSGMNIARINCAHDDENTWVRMIDHVKKSQRGNRRPLQNLYGFTRSKDQNLSAVKKEKESKDKNRERSNLVFGRAISCR